MFILKKKPDEVEELSETAPSLRQLDVTVLHSLILEKYLGIDKENMAAQMTLFDDQGKMIMPGEFIRIAEENGMIRKIGERVFEKVCRFFIGQNLEQYGIQ